MRISFFKNRIGSDSRKHYPIITDIELGLSIRWFEILQKLLWSSLESLIVTWVESFSERRDQGCQVGIFKAKIQTFGLFESVFWHVRHSFAFFGLFVWCWHKKTLIGIFWNLWLSCCCRLGIENFSQDIGPLFSTTAPFSKIQAVLPSKWRHRAKNMIAYLFWARLRKLWHI